MDAVRNLTTPCEAVWDGVDFTSCARDKYLAAYPYFLIALSFLWVVSTYLRSYLASRSRPAHARLTPATLTSPAHDSSLALLESDVILSALAASLLPPSEEKGKLAPTVPSKEAGPIIEGYKVGNARMERWRTVKRWIRLVGAVVWIGVEVAKGVKIGEWRGVPFAAWILVLSILPRMGGTGWISVHLFGTVIDLRSQILRHQHGISLAPLIVELVYWAMLISVPYGQTLSRLLADARSRGGASSGSYGHNLPRHIEEPTSAFSRATYTFILPLLFRHYWSPIKLEQIPQLREDDVAAASLGGFRAEQAVRDTAYAQAHGGEKRKRNLAWDLLRFFGPEVTAQCLWAVVYVSIQYLAPVGLQLLLRFISERETSDVPGHVAWLYVAMMAGGQLMQVIAMGQSLYIGRRVCIRLRSIIITEVFTKALRRRDISGHIKKEAKASPADPDSPTGSKKDIKADKEAKDKQEEPEEGASEGKINNLVSGDAFMISEVCAYLFYFVAAPWALVINIALLYQTLGLAAIAGVGVLIGVTPVQYLFAKLYTVAQQKYMAATDARLEAVTEVVAHIKLIKFNAWETKFFERMLGTRQKELYHLAQRFAAAVLANTLIYALPALVTTVAYSIHVLVLHQPLTADRAFSSLILFNMLRDPLAVFEDTFTRILQAYTSCCRIQKYLEEPETLKYAQLSRPGPADPQIGFKGAIIAYGSAEDIKDAEFEPFKLGELDLSFPVGQLSVITGPVGSGKSTLVLSLLGETILLQGKIYMPDDKANRDFCPIDATTGLSDTMAYCAQTAWLIGASIKENIVFGSRWNQKRYDQVLDACALRKDLEIFENGDETEVGEKGTTCSGGQKARIALARALYSPAKTIILDDVLSAVDAQTARHLHEQCLLGPLMKGRTVILVSHAVNLVVPSAAFVVMLDDGRVTASGSPSELTASGILDLAAEETDNASSGSGAASDTLLGDGPSIAEEKIVDPVSHPPTGEALAEAGGDLEEAPAEVLPAKLQGTVEIVAYDGATPDAPAPSKGLVAAEGAGSGTIGLGVYALYFRMMGGWVFWLLLVGSTVGSQVVQVWVSAWIRDWANSADRASQFAPLRAATTLFRVVDRAHRGLQSLVFNDESNEKSTQFYVTVYIAINALYIVSVVARSAIGYWGGLHASRKMYSRLLKRILGAKMRFFDSTPSGRIMNRLSKDMSSIDSESAEILMIFAWCTLSVLAVLYVVVISTPAFLLALVVITVLFWLVGSLYVTTSTEIKRYDSTTRSPIFVSFSEALVGMSTIRSYADSARFMRKLFEEIDQNSRCFWYLWQTNRVLNNFSNFVGALVTIFACLFALNNHSMNAGAVGFSITYALSFTEFALWIVRLYAASQMTMNSVERVSEYLDLDVEEEDHAKGVEPPAYWPSKGGSVVVEGLTCKYAPQLEPVLRDVSFTIAPKEKIGICGRTGSGKSTLALSFFRFLHQESGRIIIDGLDISKLSLTTLRSRLTILPQEAQLFSGSVRDNLDPFGQHEDAEIWDALRQCGLAGKTPGPTGPASRAISRSGSGTNLVAQAKQTAAMRVQTLKKLQAEAMHPAKERSASDDSAAAPDVEVEERVVIRSLDERVAVGGKNFSQGQRQLLALARGLLKLRNSNFLIMDESTANLDHATDATIQNVLRTGLADIQMLVIAHRLLTVCGLDKILVLDHGKVVEFGTPWELLQDERGTFRDLCRQSGEERELFEMARAIDEAKRKAGV